MGSSVVNALSSWLEVEITRDGAVYKQRFEDGENQLQPLKRSALLPKSKTGTKVTFMPDPTIFQRRISNSIPLLSESKNQPLAEGRR